MIFSSDKNLGPMVVNRDDYVKAMMEHHSSNRGTHEIITKEEATEYLLEASNAFIRCISQAGNSINSNDMKQITRFLEQDKRKPVMYGLGKLHKGKIFLPPCVPVVAILGSQLCGMCTWVDTCLNTFYLSTRRT